MPQSSIVNISVCQGCALSPFRLTVVMSILVASAHQMLSSSVRKDIECHRLFDISYADDTLICGACPASVEEYAAAVEKAGSEFGLCLHWGKTQALAVCADGILRDPQGNRVEDTGSMVYLGALLTADGRTDSEGPAMCATINLQSGKSVSDKPAN